MKGAIFIFLLTVSISAQTDDLYFSEYIEGSSNNKALEIYNSTGSSIDLVAGRYAVQFFFNGNTTPGATIYLTGTVAAGGVFVLANSSAVKAVLDRADQKVGGSWYNGDDAVALTKGGIVIDVIGRIGEDPGSEWGGGLCSTADNTLRRKPSVCRGDSNGADAFDPNLEWDGYSTDAFDGLGTHSALCGSTGITPIRNIQQTSHPNGDSPLKDKSNITTEGIVSAVFQGSYVVQFGAGEWSGLWIVDAAHTPAIGDRLRLCGTVREIDGLTSLADLTAFQVISSGNSLPPGQPIDAGGAAQEKWEGVLLRLNQVDVANSSIGNGEWSISDGSAVLVIGKKGNYSYSPVTGDRLDAVIGVLEQSSTAFKLQPRDDNDILRQPKVKVVINELLADPTDDANQNGVVETYHDEFVELLNLGSEAVDLSGWRISDAAAVRHVFPAGTRLPAGGGIVVFGGGAPIGDFGGAIVQTASSGRLELNNSGDTVTLSNNDQVIDSVTYGSEGNSDQSITRDPDGTGAWVKHRTAGRSNKRPFSPGRRIDGSSFFSTYLHDIQGRGDVSPFDNCSGVTVEAVVVGCFRGDEGLGGFFLQEEDHQVDEDPSTSEGLFVYTDIAPVSLGDLVRVTGTVSEFYGKTQMSRATSLIVIGTAPLPTTVAVQLPLASPNDWERYEGMRIQIQQPLTITGLGSLAEYGEVELSVGGRLYSPTQIVSPGVEAVAHRSLNNRSRIQLDDGSRVVSPAPVPYTLNGLPLRLGAQIASLSGVVDYSYGSFEIHPTQPLIFLDENPRSTAPVAVDGVIKVAAWNVGNFFNGDGRGGGFPSSRGAASFQEYQRQKQKLVCTLTAIDAEIVGLIEIENDGFGPTSALQDLLSGLNKALGAEIYRALDLGMPRVGNDEITNAVIYKPAAVEPVGRPKLLDHSVAPSFDAFTRPSIAQTFQDGEGDKFTLVINHFRSKGGSCAGDEDRGDGQGACNGTRTAAATALMNWLAGDPTDSRDADILILGDLNAYAREDPLTVLTAAGYRNEIDRFLGSTAYTYVYNSESGCLDHALASPSLDRQITGLVVWHINADETEVLGYREAGQNDFVDSPFRSSDHDPIIIGLDPHDPSPVELSAFAARWTGDGVRLNWQTETEPDLAGFHLYRSRSCEAAFVKITQELIKSQGDSSRGARYEWFDPQGNRGNAYKLELLTIDGRSRFEGPVVVAPSEIVVGCLPQEFRFLSPFPNPFNESVLFTFSLPREEQVILSIYNLSGRPVRILCLGRKAPGTHGCRWDGRDDEGGSVSAGIYFCRIQTPSFTAACKIALVR